MKDTVSFERNGNVIKKTIKKHRDFVPGIIERSEEYRADLIETDNYVKNLVERRFPDYKDW